MGWSHGRLVHIGPGAMGAVTTKTAKCTISPSFGRPLWHRTRHRDNVSVRGVARAASIPAASLAHKAWDKAMVAWCSLDRAPWALWRRKRPSARFRLHFDDRYDIEPATTPKPQNPKTPGYAWGVASLKLINHKCFKILKVVNYVKKSK